MVQRKELDLRFPTLLSHDHNTIYFQKREKSQNEPELYKEILKKDASDRNLHENNLLCLTFLRKK